MTFIAVSLPARASRTINLIALFLVLLTAGCSNIVSLTRDEPISEDYTKRTSGAYVDDGFIETKTEVNLKKVDSRFKKAQVRVDSYNGVVLLTGNVPESDMRDLASDTVKKIRKVRSVHNELKVSPPKSFSTRIGDGWLKSKIATRLLFHRNIKSSRYHVVVNDGVIYLMGLSTRKNADLVVAAVQQSYGVQKIVRAFEYID